MNNKSVKLGKDVTLNKDAVTKLQEDHLNKIKGGNKGKDAINDNYPTIDTNSISCMANTCNRC